MNDTTQNPEVETAAEEEGLTEKQILLQKARMMGLQVSNNISVEKLRERIDEHVSAESSTASDKSFDDDDDEQEELGEYAIPEGASIHRLRQDMRKKAMALVRVRIGNMDPKKADLQGEIHTIHNDLIGTIKHMVPYGDRTENGWMLPRIMVDHLKSRQFQHIRSYTHPQTKQIVVETTLRNEFVIEELPQLTPAELAELRAAQAGQ